MVVTAFGGSREGTTVNNTFNSFGANSLQTASEVNRQQTVRFAGTFSRFSGIFDANGAARKYQFRKNAANANLVLSPADSTAQQFLDWVHTDHFAVGDKFDAQGLVTGTGFIAKSYALLFAADSGTIGFCGSQTISVPAATTRFGAPSTFTDLVERGVVIRAPCTIRNMTTFTAVNTTTTASTITSRKNLAAGAQSVTIPAGTTGAFEDTTNSDSFASGDKFSHSVTCGATAAVSFTTVFTIVYNTNASEIFSGTPLYPFAAGGGFGAIFGANNAASAENLVSIPIGVDASVSNLRIFSDSNTMTGTTTIVFRKNGVTGNQTLSIPAATTGAFEDTTHTDVFKAADNINYMLTGGTSGSLSSNVVAMTMTPYTIPYWQRQRQFLRR